MSTSVTIGPSLRNAFGQALLSQANQGVSFMAWDGDVQGGTGLTILAAEYPDRVIQGGIAEQAIVGAASGYALATGQPQVICLFASFGLRAYEIAKLSAFYNQANVKLVFSHVGLDVGPDGSSAQELCHYACWRSIPNAVVLHPCCAQEMSGAVGWMLAHDGPVVLFTGRSPVHDLDITFEFNHIQPVAGSGRDCYLFATGNQVAQAVEAETILGNGYGVEVTVFNVSTLKPLDAGTLTRLAMDCPLWFTIEDHGYEGGLHGAIAEVVVQMPWSPRVVPIAVPSWGESGEPEELRAKYGLDGVGIAKRVLEEL